MQSTVTEFLPQSLPSFMARQFPPKVPLIEGVLYRRDRVSITGRRRHGKTTAIMNIGLAGPMAHKEILGYPIVMPYRTLAFYLEDDSRELQDKLRKLTGGVFPKGFHLYVADDFLDKGIPVNVENAQFQQFVESACKAAKPDLVMFDNLGELIGADYTNSTRIHALSKFTRHLGKTFDCATLIAAHPRKHNKLDGKKPLSLSEDTEMFFEECMGSSHFINSTGNLWGVERVDDETTICLGAQRMGDVASFTRAELDEWGWFRRVGDAGAIRDLSLTTEKRKRAWNLLPLEFSYKEAETLLSDQGVMRNSSWNAFWRDLKRHEMIVPSGNERYCKAGTQAQKKPS